MISLPRLTLFLLITLASVFNVSGNDCATAWNIECGTVEGRIYGGFFPSFGYCVTSPGFGGADWYKITGTGGTYIAETFPVSSDQFNTKLWVLTGGCGVLSCVTGDDDGGGSGGYSKVSFPTVAGQEYLLVVGGYLFGQGNYKLSVSIGPPTAPDDSICGPGVANLTASGTPSFYWYDAATGGNLLSTGPAYNPSVSALTSFFVESRIGPLPNSLTTNFTGTNSGNGNMFDIQAIDNILIESFEISPTSGFGTIEVFFKAGSYQGFQNNASAWQSIANVPFSGTPAVIKLNKSLAIPAGETYAIYITTNGGTNLNYSNGIAVGNIAAQDANLRVLEGLGLSYPFGSAFSPRIWNGKVNYTLINPAVLQTTFTSNNSGAGNMFDIVAKTDLTITSLDCHLATSEDIVIYYREGSYQSYQNNPIGWTLIDTFSVIGQGMGVPTPILLPEGIYIPAGTRYAFYISIIGTGTLRYTDGTGVGNPAAETAWLRIEEGVGKAYPFGTSFSPRIWNGNIHFVFGNNCGSSDREEVEVRVDQLPQFSIVEDAQCGPGYLTLQAFNTSGGNTLWYTDSVGGSFLTYGNYYYPFLNTTTSFWVEDDLPGCPGYRKRVTGTINPIPPGPPTVSDYNCGPGYVSLSASSSLGGTLEWYTDQFGGFLVTNSTSYTPFLNSSTTYWIREVSAAGCAGPRNPVTGEIRTIPTLPSVTPYTRCGPGQVNLQAFGSGGGILNWYTAPSGGTAIFSGNYYYPTISASTSWYVSEFVNGCEGPRTQITGTVNEIPPAPQVNPIFICGTGSVTIQANDSLGGSIQWFDAPSGGTQLSALPILTTPVLSTTTTYYVQETSPFGCIGPRASVQVEVRPVPLPPGGISASRCGVGVLNLSAVPSGPGTINWYSSFSGGAVLTTGTSYSPNVSGTTSFWVETELNGCPSATRTEVVATVSPFPPSPSVTGGSHCGPGIVSMMASGTGILRWYADSTSQTSVFLGTAYSPNVSTTTTYWVENDNGFCVSPRAKVTATIFPIPPLPASVNGDTICGPGSATLSATSSGGTINWYDAPTGGTQVGSGSLISVSVMSNVSYWAEQVSANGCISSGRVEAAVVINPVTPIPNGMGASRCGPGPITLSASPIGQGTIFWYAMATGGSPVGTGLTYSPTITGTTSFWAESVLNGCNSAGRTQVMATVDPVPPAPSVTGGSHCGPGMVALSASGTGTLSWFADSTSQTSLFVGTSYTPFVSTNTTFWVANDNGTCVSARTPVTAIVLSLPQLPAAVNGDTICGPGTAILSAMGSGGTLNWYDAPTGGTLVGSGSMISVQVTDSISYWVDQVNAIGCTSASRVEARVVVKTILPPPAVENAQLCGSGIAMLGASGISGSTFNWYDAPTGGNLVHTGSQFSPFLLASKSYWVTQILTGCESLRTQVTATIVPVPPKPIIIQKDSICGPGTANLQVSGTGGLLFWYDASISGNLLSEGTHFQTTISTTTDYWVREAQIRPTQLLAQGAQISQDSLNSNGFWFVAPASFVIMGLRVPLDASSAPGQSVLLVRMNSAPSTSTAGTISNFDILGHYPNALSTGTIEDTIPVRAGEVIGILGVRGGVNSLTTGGYASSLDDNPVTLYSLSAPGNLQGTAPPILMSDPASPAGRIEIYYAPSCFGPHEKIQAVVKTVPLPPATTDNAVCGPDTVQLSAAGSGGMLRWYDADSAGMLLHTGNLYSPFVPNTTEFWVSETLLGCEGERSPVSGIVNVIPQPPATTGDTICGTGLVTLTASHPLSGTFNWFASPSGGNAVFSGMSYSPTLSDTTTFWVDFTDGICTSGRTAVTAILNSVPPPPSVSDLLICGSDTVSLKASGTGGILQWFDAPENGNLISTGDSIRFFLSIDREFWVREMKDGCVSELAMVSANASAVPAAPVVSSAKVCGPDMVTLYASSPGGIINWYNSPESDSVVHTGSSLSVLVFDTVSYWVGIAGSTIGRAGPQNNRIGGGVFSSSFSDGLVFDVQRATNLTDVTVYPQDTGLLVIRLLGPNSQLLQSTTIAITDTGETLVPVNFLINPGTGYRLDAIGSTVKGLYRNHSGASYPYTSDDVIIRRSSNNQAGYYYFFYDWGLGNCEGKRSRVTGKAYQQAIIAPVPPTFPGRYFASFECEGNDGWTHYYFDSGTPDPTDDLLLLSINKNGSDIGTVGDGTFSLLVASSDASNEGAGFATRITAPYVSNVDGWWVMNRSWTLNPTNQPQQPVLIRFYYNDADLTEINNALMAAGDTILSDHQDLYLYLLRNGDPNPDYGQTGAGLSDYQELVNGATAVSGVWRDGMAPNYRFAEFTTSFLHGGGMGKGAGQKGALSTGLLSARPSGSFVVLDWSAVTVASGEYFEVQKSLDGEIFQPIGTVPFLQDVPGMIEQYSFTDSIPIEGLNYYRVKFIFDDGNVLFTNRASIDFSRAQNGLVAVYPNPFQKKINFRFSNLIGGVSLDVFNLEGQDLFHANWIESEGLVQEVDLRQLPVGIYIYRLEFSDTVVIGKIVKSD
jgi:hypothetical protein